MTTEVASAPVRDDHHPAGTTVAAASSTLRGTARCTFVIAEAPNGPRFPNGYVPAGGPAPAAAVAVAVPPQPIVARRWWDPRIRVERIDRQCAARLVGSTQPIALPRPPEDIVGWGPGLTPAGDDVVVGMLVAFHAAGATTAAVDLAAACGAEETTPLSRSLIDHASRGEAVRPLLDLLRALAGSGDVDRSLAGLRRFGATSGMHLIDGVRRAVIELGLSAPP